MISTVVVLADYAGTLDLQSRTEARVRVTEGAQNPGVDLLESPSGRVTLRNRSWTHTFGYAPHLILPDLELGISPELLHNGDIATTWHTRHVQLGLAEYGTYGQENSAYLPTIPTGQAMGTPVPVQLLAPPFTARFGYSRTAFTTNEDLGRRWRAATSVDYVMGGGLDASSRQLIPFLRGPRADVALNYRAGRIDAFETRAEAQRSAATRDPCASIVFAVNGTMCAAQTDLVQLTEQWRHFVAHSTEASLGGGASVVRSRLLPELPYRDTLYPVALVSLEHSRILRTQRMGERFDAQLAPIVDTRTGAADYRAQATFTLTLPLRRATVRGVFGATRSIQSDYLLPSTFVRADAELDYEIGRYTSLGGGIRLAWQDQETLGSFATGMTFVQATFHAPKVRF